MQHNDEAAGARPGRRHVRRAVRGLDTPFGVILDLSESGACLFRKGRVDLEVGQTVTLSMAHQGIELRLQAHVVRMNRLGIGRQEVGVIFENLDDQQRLQLRQLAESASAEFSPSVWLAA